MEGGHVQPLAEGKGVCGDAESEGSRRQSCDPRNTNFVRGTDVWASLLHKAKAKIGPKNDRVDEAGVQRKYSFLPGEACGYAGRTPATRPKRSG